MGTTIRSFLSLVLALQIALAPTLSLAQGPEDAVPIAADPNVPIDPATGGPDLAEMQKRFQTVQEPIPQVEPIGPVQDVTSSEPSRAPDDKASGAESLYYKMFRKDENFAINMTALGGGTALVLGVRYALRSSNQRLMRSLEQNGLGYRARFTELQAKYPQYRAELSRLEGEMAKAEKELSEVIKKSPDEYKKPLIDSIAPDACRANFGRLGQSGSWAQARRRYYDATIGRARRAFGPRAKPQTGQGPSRPSEEPAPDASRDRIEEQTPIAGIARAEEGRDSADSVIREQNNGAEAPSARASEEPSLVAQQVQTIKDFEAKMKEVEAKYEDYLRYVESIREDVKRLTDEDLAPILLKAEDLRQQNRFGGAPIFNHPRARALMHEFDTALALAESNIASIVDYGGDASGWFRRNVTRKVIDERLLVREEDGKRHVRRGHQLVPWTWPVYLRDTFVLWRSMGVTSGFTKMGKRAFDLIPLWAILAATIGQEMDAADEKAQLDAEKARSAQVLQALTEEARSWGDATPLVYHWIGALENVWNTYRNTDDKPLMSDLTFPLKKDLDSVNLLLGLWDESVSEGKKATTSAEPILWMKIFTRMHGNALPLADKPNGPEAWLNKQRELEKDTKLVQLAKELAAKTPEEIQNAKGTKEISLEEITFLTMIGSLLWTKSQIEMGDKFPFGTTEVPLVLNNPISNENVRLWWIRGVQLSESLGTDPEEEFWTQVLLAAELGAGNIEAPTNLQERRKAEEKVRTTHKDMIREWAVTSYGVLASVLPAALTHVRDTFKPKPAAPVGPNGEVLTAPPVQPGQAPPPSGVPTAQPGETPAAQPMPGQPGAAAPMPEPSKAGESAASTPPAQLPPMPEVPNSEALKPVEPSLAPQPTGPAPQPAPSEPLPQSPAPMPLETPTPAPNQPAPQPEPTAAL